MYLLNKGLRFTLCDFFGEGLTQIFHFIDGANVFIFLIHATNQKILYTGHGLMCPYFL